MNNDGQRNRDGALDGAGDGARSEQFWENFYGQREQVWSGRANPVLVDVVRSLPPGTALDLGCGEGGDAVWLAQQGWRVIAVDVSGSALQRAASLAASAGVAEHITFAQHDLARTFPAGAFDLVSAQYLHSPVDFPRAQVLQAAARVVAPNGLLLIVDHGSAPPWSGDHGAHSHPHFPTADGTLASLDLSPEQWYIEQVAARERRATGPNGEVADVTDNVISVRRLTAP